MKALEERLLQPDRCVGGEVVRVGDFLNHRVDTALAVQIGQAFHQAFADERVDCVLTVEASGIVFALTTAMAFGNIPVVFAKKGETRNVTGEAYTADVYSFTHQRIYAVRVEKACLPAGSRVLLIDDFLANGEALLGLMDIARQAECEVVGAGVCVEKGFQSGGAKLRQRGVRVVSLATVDSICGNRVNLRES